MLVAQFWIASLSQRYCMDLHRSREHSSTATQHNAVPVYLRPALGTVTLGSCAAAPECPFLLVNAFLRAIERQLWVQLTVAEFTN